MQVVFYYDSGWGNSLIRFTKKAIEANFSKLFELFYNSNIEV